MQTGEALQQPNGSLHKLPYLFSSALQYKYECEAYVYGNYNYPPVITVAPAGLAGFLCDVTEEPVSFTDCLHGAPGCSFAPAVISNLIRGIRDSDYANLLARENGAELGFSVTQLVGCPRQFVLKKQNPYYEKVSAMYRMAFGL